MSEHSYLDYTSELTLSEDFLKVAPELADHFKAGTLIDFHYGGPWRRVDTAESKVDEADFFKIGSDNLQLVMSVPFQMTMQNKEGQWEEVFHGLAQMKAEFKLKQTECSKGESCKYKYDYSYDVSVKKLYLEREGGEAIHLVDAVRTHTNSILKRMFSFGQQQAHSITEY